ncbi:MAG: septum formation initiator family protein [Lachnospiraceae bacterium]|nr:septum formation initiator family protein [Lachnospiraceae bacterium]MDD3617219.1 septum formation initiator family protein [Lachnospiraceae bacterium]
MSRKNNTTGRAARKRQKRNIITMFCITGVVCAIFVALLLQNHSLQQKIAGNQQKQEALTAEIEEETARTEEIENMETYLQSDEYMEKAAREKAGLVKDNEIIFKESN